MRSVPGPTFFPTEADFRRWLEANHENSDELLNVGKAYTGLTDVEIEQMTEWFLAHTVEDEGWRRTVEPSIVIEVAFNAVMISDRHNSGYALEMTRPHRTFQGTCHCFDLDPCLVTARIHDFRGGSPYQFHSQGTDQIQVPLEVSWGAK